MKRNLAIVLLLIMVVGMFISCEGGVVDASAGPNGRIDPEGSIQIPLGGTQQFDIIPNSGYMTDTVFFDGTPYVGNYSIFTVSNIFGNHTLRVSYKKSTVKFGNCQP